MFHSTISSICLKVLIALFVSVILPLDVLTACNSAGWDSSCLLRSRATLVQDVKKVDRLYKSCIKYQPTVRPTCLSRKNLGTSQAHNRWRNREYGCRCSYRSVILIRATD